MNNSHSQILVDIMNLIREKKLESNQYLISAAINESNSNIGKLISVGLSCAQGERLDDALIIFSALHQHKKDDFKISYNLGLLHSLRGNHQLAINLYDLALSLQKDDLDTLINKAASLSDLKKYSSALNVLNKVLSIDPSIPEAWSNKGIVLNTLNLFGEAVDSFREALRLNPNYYEALSNISVPLNKLGRFDEAYLACEQAIILKPDYAQAYSNKGYTLHELKRYSDAIACYEKALSLTPNFSEAYLNLGNSLHELKRYSDAIACYEKALSLKPDYAEAYSNKGYTLNELGKYSEAIACYDKAMVINPNYAEAWLNKGESLYELSKFEEAAVHYDKALSIKTNYAEALWNKSLLLLLRGDYERGFPLYESRWEIKKVSEIAGKRNFDKPTWLGRESIQGKTILVYSEQGFGDFIQFCRYVSLVSDLGATVILEVPRELYSLLKNMKGISQLVIQGGVLPSFDYQCPLLSLPLAFNTKLESIPSVEAYRPLKKSLDSCADWELSLGPKKTIRVGLVWSGNPQHKNDHNRSLTLTSILPYLPSQFEYVSLQKEVRDIDKLTLDSSLKIKNFPNLLDNFEDTARLIKELDLVITVDTSVAHISGALGQKTWILVPYVPDWRWLLDREDSPWYPSVRLYRQFAIGEWNGVLQLMKKDLENLA